MENYESKENPLRDCCALGQAKNDDGLDSGGMSTEDENGSDSHYIWNS